MKSTFLSAISAVAVALIAAAPLSQAAPLSPGQFNAGVKAAIGTKTGKAAYNAAAAYYKKALSSKDNKKFVTSYTAGVLSALKKALKKTNDIANSRAALADALAKGYFAGLKYNAADAKFQGALKKISSGLPKPLQTEATAKLITKKVLAFNNSKGGGTTGQEAINKTVYTALHQPVPPIPS